MFKIITTAALGLGLLSTAASADVSHCGVNESRMNPVSLSDYQECWLDEYRNDDHGVLGSLFWVHVGGDYYSTQLKNLRTQAGVDSFLANIEANVEVRVQKTAETRSNTVEMIEESLYADLLADHINALEEISALMIERDALQVALDSLEGTNAGLEAIIDEKNAEIAALFTAADLAEAYEEGYSAGDKALYTWVLGETKLKPSALVAQYKIDQLTIADLEGALHSMKGQRDAALANVASLEAQLTAAIEAQYDTSDVTIEMTHKDSALGETTADAIYKVYEVRLDGELVKRIHVNAKWAYDLGVDSVSTHMWHWTPGDEHKLAVTLTNGKLKNMPQSLVNMVVEHVETSAVNVAVLKAQAQDAYGVFGIVGADHNADSADIEITASMSTVTNDVAFEDLPAAAQTTLNTLDEMYGLGGIPDSILQPLADTYGLNVDNINEVKLNGDGFAGYTLKVTTEIVSGYKIGGFEMTVAEIEANIGAAIQEAYNEGYDDGYSAGYTDGYSDGFTAGVDSVK